MQVDPKGESLMALNPYNSMANNPIGFTDPMGDFIGEIAGAAIYNWLAANSIMFVTAPLLTVTATSLATKTFGTMAGLATTGAGFAGASGILQSQASSTVSNRGLMQVTLGVESADKALVEKAIDHAYEIFKYNGWDGLVEYKIMNIEAYKSKYHGYYGKVFEFPNAGFTIKNLPNGINMPAGNTSINNTGMLGDESFLDLTSLNRNAYETGYALVHETLHSIIGYAYKTSGVTHFTDDKGHMGEWPNILEHGPTLSINSWDNISKGDIYYQHEFNYRTDMSIRKFITRYTRTLSMP